jgi:hypothetical protein
VGTVPRFIELELIVDMSMLQVWQDKDSPTVERMTVFVSNHGWREFAVRIVVRDESTPNLPHTVDLPLISSVDTDSMYTREEQKQTEKSDGH